MARSLPSLPLPSSLPLSTRRIPLQGSWLSRALLAALPTFASAATNPSLAHLLVQVRIFHPLCCPHTGLSSRLIGFNGIGLHVRRMSNVIIRNIKSTNVLASTGDGVKIEVSSFLRWARILSIRFDRSLLLRKASMFGSTTASSLRPLSLTRTTTTVSWMLPMLPTT